MPLRRKIKSRLPSIKFSMTLLLAYFAISQSACNQLPCSNLIKTIKTVKASDGSSVTATLVYDAGGRQRRMTNTNGRTNNYDYNVPGQLTLTIKKNGFPDQIIIYTLDNNHVATSDNQGNTYFYTVFGAFLWLTKAQYSNYIDTRSILNDNIVSESQNYPSNPASDVTYTITYVPTVHVCHSDGIGYLGMENLDWPHTMTSTQVGSGPSPIVTNYTYTYMFDSQNRVIQQATSINGTLDRTNYYTY
jgi:hypothetical protein